MVLKVIGHFPSTISPTANFPTTNFPSPSFPQQQLPHQLNPFREIKEFLTDLGTFGLSAATRLALLFISKAKFT